MTSPQYLDSAILRLAKERNEAREIVKRLLYSAGLSNDSIERNEALGEAFKAACKWKGGGDE